MSKSWRRAGQIRVEDGTWEDDTRITILHGRCALAIIGGLFFVTIGLHWLTCPLYFLPGKRVVLFCILVPAAGLWVLSFGLPLLFERTYLVIDAGLGILQHGTESFRRCEGQSLPLDAVRSIELVPWDHRYGRTYNVLATFEVDGDIQRVSLHQFNNSEKRARRFVHIVSRLLPRATV